MRRARYSHVLIELFTPNMHQIVHTISSHSERTSQAPQSTPGLSEIAGAPVATGDDELQLVLVEPEHVEADLRGHPGIQSTGSCEAWVSQRAVITCIAAHMRA